MLALIEEYRNGKEPGEKAKAVGFTSYMPRATYDAYNPSYRIILPDGPINGTACAKFAFAFIDDVFGDVPMREISISVIRPGDLLHFSGHWAIATKKVYYSSDDNCYLTSNVGGGTTGSIGWGNTDVNVNGLIAAYTRYPLPSETE